MRITTRGRYGLRAMVEMARSQNGGPVMMRQITERQRIPRKYLHSLLTDLRKNGLIRSLRGSRGGYVLARDPEKITAREIIEILEGKIKLVDCREHGGPCKMYRSCATRALWADLGDLLRDRLDGVTLAQLADDRPARRSRKAV